MKTKTNFITKILGALLLVLTFSTAAMAQDKTAERAAKITDNMKTKLTLTDAQYEKVYSANLDFLNQSQKLRKSESVDKLEKSKQLKAYGEAKDAKIKAVLTPEQYTVYLANKRENKTDLRSVVGEKKVIKKEVKE